MVPGPQPPGHRERCEGTDSQVYPRPARLETLGVDLLIPSLTCPPGDSDALKSEDQELETPKGHKSRESAAAAGPLKQCFSQCVFRGAQAHLETVNGYSPVRDSTVNEFESPLALIKLKRCF